MQDNWPSVLFAMAGGVVLSLGNLSTQYAWAFVGLSVTEVITSSITVVIGLSLSLSAHDRKCSRDNLIKILFVVLFTVTGTTLNYFLDDKINKAEILFPGVGCFLIAVCLGSAVHSSNAADNKAKLSTLSKDGAGYVINLLGIYNGLETLSSVCFLIVLSFWIKLSLSWP